MTTHESGINFRNLIRDLADMYPVEADEVVVIELIANSLDAGATQIHLDFDRKRNTLIVADNGKGMSSKQFEEYHDFAAGLKTRGVGIGFAGVGAKISFNISDRVLTETRSESGSFSGGSDWHIDEKGHLVWNEVAPQYLTEPGTRVEITFRQGVVPDYRTSDDLVALLRRHYFPLLDSRFLRLYETLGAYSRNLRFYVNGHEVSPTDSVEAFGLTQLKEFFPTRGSKRVGYGLFGLAPTEYPLGSGTSGIAICTRGKVIKTEFFSQFPGPLGPRMFGMGEVPPLVEYLTTAKNDFVRGRATHKQFENLYGPVRDAFRQWMVELGLETAQSKQTDEATQLERELTRLLKDVPELSDFFGFRTKRATYEARDLGGTGVNPEEGGGATFPVTPGPGNTTRPGPTQGGPLAEATLQEDKAAPTKQADPISRRGRRGPQIGFIDAPEKVDLSWVDGNQVFINSAHPAFIKSRANNGSRRVHSLFAVGAAIQKYLASNDTAPDLAFLDRMMAAWGTD